MAYLGVCKNTGAVYEGAYRERGFRFFPAPVLSPATIVEAAAEEYQASHKSHPYELIFREDSFDPITQVRRGRLYKWSDKFEWYVNDPYRQDLKLIPQMQGHKLDANTYERHPIIQNREGERDYRKLKLLLGKERYFTVWEILSVEMMANDEELYTIKSLRTLNNVLDVKQTEHNVEIYPRLEKAVCKLRDCVDRMSPESVIEASRNVLSIVFSWRIGCKKMDLGQAVSHYIKTNENQPDMIASCGKIVARMHVRCKDNEKENLQFRDVTEHDAQLAIECVNFLLQEQGWVEDKVI